ncbi:hypothetical protein HYC85_008367 [Camellia sinensis]|uniref:Cyclin N-terminal domain-containing protein n=1 Tax=Camellia sinensis TaxID=4442 RepID=A0A7J7HTB9_CAMSI|nr:hypothetical protein HYC85_008367 [Camellia sinensis]
MENYDSLSTPSLSSQLLLCQESETCLDQQQLDDETTFIDLTTNYSVVSDTRQEKEDDDDEYVQMLLHRELSVGLQWRQSKSEPSNLAAIDSWIECSRLDAITWILKTRALFGFRFQTAYLSVIYFDRFLSKRFIDNKKDWAIRLLSLACLSLAAKMEECRAPAVSEYRDIEDYNLESKVIQRMELLVLNTLEWRLSSVTPFDYINYFITKFCKDQSPPRNIISRIGHLILAMMRDAKLMAHRPSVIAGAAALVALDGKLARQALELKINALSPSRFLEIEDVFSCYNRMQELEMGKITIPKCIKSADQSPGLRDAFENSSVTSALSTKRKRLTISGCDQNYGVPDEKRQQQR